MDRLNRLAAHVSAAPNGTTLAMTQCAGWKMLPGPHPGHANVATLQVSDEKEFIANMEAAAKKFKAEGGPLLTGMAIFKMDSGLYLQSAFYSDDMERVANKARVLKARLGASEASTKNVRVLDMCVQKAVWSQSFVDERPMQVTGCRIWRTTLHFKSPAHLERWNARNPEGELHAALGAEYKAAGVKMAALSRCSDSSMVFTTILSDEKAWSKGRDDVLAKLAAAYGINTGDYSASPAERETGVCIFMKNMSEF